MNRVYKRHSIYGEKTDCVRRRTGCSEQLLLQGVDARCIDLPFLFCEMKLN